jgi:hypothetical protein
MPRELPDSLEWQAYEYLHVDRTPDWYWGVGVATLVLALVGILLENILFAVLVVVAAFTVTLRALKVPDIQKFSLTRKGIIEDTTLYPYGEIESFWVDDEQVHSKLLVKSRRPLMPLIIIPLGDVDPEIVHDYLIQFIDAEEMTEPFFQKVMEYLGF